MAVQTVQTIGRAGLNLETVAVAADVGLTEKWAGTGAEFLYVNNGQASPITVTITIEQTVDGQTVAARTVSVPASHHMLIGPFPTGVYNDTSGNVNISWSSATSVTLAVLLLGR